MSLIWRVLQPPIAGLVSGLFFASGETVPGALMLVAAFAGALAVYAAFREISA